MPVTIHSCVPLLAMLTRPLMSVGFVVVNDFLSVAVPSAAIDHKSPRCTTYKALFASIQCIPRLGCDDTVENRIVPGVP